MKKIDVGQTIAVLANLGVIAGIVFLGIELRQNNEQMAAQSRYNYYQRRIDFGLTMALNTELREAVGKMRRNEELTPLERGRLFDFYLAQFTAWEYEFGEMQRGAISEEEFNSPVKRIFFENFQPMTGNTWNTVRESTPVDFRDYFDEHIAYE